MGGGGRKKRKDNSGKGVPPMPEEKKPGLKRCEILGEARQLLSPSPTPSAAGSRIGALDDGDKDRIGKMAIIVSEDEGDKVNPAAESEEDDLDFGRLDYNLLPLEPNLKPPPPILRSAADQRLIEGLERELKEVKAGVRMHLDGLVSNYEAEKATMAAKIETLRKAVEAAEAEAARVKKMHSDHEGFWERKLKGYEESLDISYRRNKTLEQGLEAEILECTKVFKENCEKKLRKEIEEEKKQLQKRMEKSKDKGVQWQTTIAPVQVEVRECEVQTDVVPELVPLPRRTYADVATQAQEKAMGSEHPKEPGGIKDGGSSPTSHIGNKGCGASGGYMTRAVVVHGVSCRQGMRDIIATARSMRFGGSRRLLGARWLVGWERRLRKKVSSVVLFFDGMVPLRRPGVWFSGRLCPVETYEFDRGRRS